VNKELKYSFKLVRKILMCFHAELCGQGLWNVSIILNNEIGRAVAIIAFVTEEASIIIVWLCALERLYLAALARPALLVRLRVGCKISLFSLLFS